LDVTNTLKYLESFPKERRPTITHVAIKAVGELLKAAPDVNGKIVFGKYVPFERVNVGCLVDINNGEDLAAALVEDVD